jgi:predicted nucleic acid-binding Zn finger protein
VFGPHSKKWYVIADGRWNEVDRNYDWEELSKLWEKIVYGPIERNEKKKTKAISYSVEGSRGNSYAVVNSGNIWTCSCPAHGFGRGKECKHILAIKSKNKST